LPNYSAGYACSATSNLNFNPASQNHQGPKTALNWVKYASYASFETNAVWSTYLDKIMEGGMRTFMSILTATVVATAAFAQDQDIETVIGEQLQAFNERDVQDAWQYASPMIQGLFGTPDNFGNMVRNGYPMVWTNREVEFLDLGDVNGVLTQRVLIRDLDGVAYILEYAMVETAEGWRINGVQVLPAPDVAA
jgi:hypothetical protein